MHDDVTYPKGSMVVVVMLKSKKVPLVIVVMEIVKVRDL